MRRYVVHNELVTMTLAGHETTANALTWLFHRLTTNPDAYDRHRAEAASVLGDRRPTAEDLERLPWTKACLQARFRLLKGHTPSSTSWVAQR